MTVGRLLSEASSWELTAWQAYFVAESERRKEASERRKFEREIEGD